MSTPIIVVDDVTKSYGPTQALGGVSLSVETGQVLGLLGPNGAGKTTLVRLLTTLLAPDRGRVTIAGLDVVDDADQVRTMIGLAGQHAAVDELLTGRENLELVGRLYHLDHRDRGARVDDVLGRFSLTDVADQLVRTYSGGMRRRLDLAATLVGRPHVLVLDEPTTGLDPRSRNELWHLIEQLVAGGTTIVLTSQYLDEVDRLADRIVVIDHGLVIAEGTADELKKRAASDVLEATIGVGEDFDLAVDLLRDVGDKPPTIDLQQRRISVPTTAGTEALVLAVRNLDEAGITATDLGLRRPTLDDVFLALTGHAVDAGTDADADAGIGVETGPADTAPGPAPVVAHGPGAPAPSPSGGLRRSFSDAAAIAKRNVLRLLRTPPLVFFAIIQPVLFVVGFPAIFGNAVATGGEDYMQYMFPGILVITALLAGGGTGVALTIDLGVGMLDRFRSLPASRSAVLAGRTLADLVRNVVVTMLMLPVGLAMGFRFGGGVGGAVAAVGLVLAFGYAVCWLYAVIGLAVKDTQAAQFLGFAPVLPLIFLSDAIVPVDSLPPGLEAFARNQPVTITTKAVRALAAGVPAFDWVWVSLAWIVAVLGASLVLARRLTSTAVS